MIQPQIAASVLGRLNNVSSGPRSTVARGPFFGSASMPPTWRAPGVLGGEVDRPGAIARDDGGADDRPVLSRGKCLHDQGDHLRAGQRLGLLPTRPSA